MTWSYTYSPQVWPALITLGLALFLASYSWRRRTIPAARPFAIAVLFGILWTLGAILEILSTHFFDKVFWLEFQAVWQPLSAAAVTTFVLTYVGLGRRLNRRSLALIFLIPTLSVVAILTNGLHHLVWTSFGMDGQVIPSVGNLYWFFIGYIYLLGIINITVLTWFAIRSPASRRPVAIIMAGQVVARGWYLMDKLYPTMFGPGESVFFAIALVSTAYALAFFRFHAIDPVAAARTAVLEQMKESMLVIDLEDRIVGSNAAAARILGKPTQQIIGRPIVEMLPAFSTITPQPSWQDHFIDAEISLGTDGAARNYTANITHLVGKSGEMLGRLLLLHDVTEQKLAQAKVLEQQRVVATLEERERLARELHDGISQVLGYVSIQAQTIHKLVREGKTQEAEPRFTSLVQAVRDTQRDVRESILNLKAGPEDAWSFLPALKQYLSDFQSHTGIHTELLLNDGLDGSEFEPEIGVQLLRVIQEALTNSRKHSQARSVKVAIAGKDHQGCVSITDDGSGFDPGSRNPDDGHHFGVIFMRERMEQIGGSIIIKSTPGAGTVVSLEAPLSGRKERT